MVHLGLSPQSAVYDENFISVEEAVRDPSSLVSSIA